MPPPPVPVPRRWTIALVAFLVWLAVGLVVSWIALAQDAQAVADGAGLVGLLPAAVVAAAMTVRRRRMSRAQQQPRRS
ncbi:hypothetical protein ACFQV2_13530 [Actinokineospora soli]|uniref:MYXO-CTERM domain-containing protein n=1 Tax=Actinokineospora soli TaxID=1048753 RepID=A0ABW2TKW7_9PSEU